MKQEKYLPLIISELCKEDYDMMQKLTQKECGVPVTLDTFRKMTDAYFASTYEVGMDADVDSQKYLESFKKRVENITTAQTSAVMQLANIYKQTPVFNGINDMWGDFNVLSVVNEWSKNKQVFVFDEDFTDELLNTENLKMIKDHFDHLPYDYFYVDISANRQVCEDVRGEGYFMHTTKQDVNGEEYYFVNITKIEYNKKNHKDPIFYSDVLTFRNSDDVDIRTKDMSGREKVPMMLPDEMGMPEHSEQSIKGKEWNILVFQTLMYLAQDEKYLDIRENAVTKNTYKKPAPNSEPKNRFSEVRMQDVGVKWGTAYRNWLTQSAKSETDGEHGHHAKSRPHVRRAHWHKFWCNKLDEYGNEIYITAADGTKEKAKELRGQWVSQIYVNYNLEKEEELPVVKHKVEAR